MNVCRMRLALLCFVGMAVLTGPAASQSENGSGRTTWSCLIDVALGREALPACDGVAYGQCINEITEARGNLGTRAAAICSQAELSAWLDAWASTLEEALWAAEHTGAIAARFAELQAQTARKCLAVSETEVLDIMAVVQCVGDAYGPFLVKELRSGR